MENAKIRSFTDLRAWQEAHKLVLFIYKLTDKLPKKEYSLVDQMKRCSVSISSNIAEGFSRSSSKEKRQFYFMSKGSVTELQNQLLICKDLSFISLEDFKIAADQTVVVHKLLNGILSTATNK